MLTEVDIKLFMTLIRFDEAYYILYKACKWVPPGRRVIVGTRLLLRLGCLLHAASPLSQVSRSTPTVNSSQGMPQVVLLVAWLVCRTVWWVFSLFHSHTSLVSTSICPPPSSSCAKEAHPGLPQPVQLHAGAVPGEWEWGHTRKVGRQQAVDLVGHEGAVPGEWERWHTIMRQGRQRSKAASWGVGAVDQTRSVGIVADEGTEGHSYTGAGIMVSPSKKAR